MITGTVKFFNTTKGFGFIAPEDGSKDVFVHISAVERSGMGPLVEGQKVTFEVQPDARGPQGGEYSGCRLTREVREQGTPPFTGVWGPRPREALFDTAAQDGRPFSFAAPVTGMVKDRPSQALDLPAACP